MGYGEFADLKTGPKAQDLDLIQLIAARASKAFG
jgi:hypothetical protein